MVDRVVAVRVGHGEWLARPARAVVVVVHVDRPAGERRLARVANAVGVEVLELDAGHAGLGHAAEVAAVGRVPGGQRDRVLTAGGRRARPAALRQRDDRVRRGSRRQAVDRVAPVAARDRAGLAGVEAAVAVEVDEHGHAGGGALVHVPRPVAVRVLEAGPAHARGAPAAEVVAV